MKGIIVINKRFVPNGYAAIMLWPFIIFKSKDRATLERKNHERIHIRQCNEMLVIPFYIAYGINYFVNLIRKTYDPYRSIVFEKEAYHKEKDLDYLKKRKFWNWIKYIK